MKAIWLIGKQSIQFLMKDRTGFIWFLLVPVMYIFIFGNAFNGGSDPADQKANLSVLNQDSGLYSVRLMSYLQSENLKIDTLQQAPEKQPLRMLTIPDSFSQKLLTGRQVELQLKLKATANAQASMTVRMAVNKAYIRLLADMSQLKLSGHRFNPAALKALDSRTPLLTLNTEYAGKHETIPHGYSQQVPAQIVQFTTLMLFIYAGHAILDEKKRGLLRRIKTSPISYTQLFLGKLCFILLLGLTQSLLILGIGHFAFHVYLGSSFVGLFLIIVTFILTIGSIALCLGFLIRNPEKMLGTAIVSGLALSAIGGCWWPIEVTPSWMQKIAVLLPTGMSLKALHMLISFGRGLADIIPYLLGLILIGAIFSTLLARLLLKYQER